MKFLLNFSISVILAAMLLSVLPVRGEEKIYNEVIRLHVIAASDSDEDQRLKLCVRDAVLDAIENAVGETDSYEESYEIIEGMKDELAETASKALMEEGCEDAVQVEFTPENYPVREYDGYTLPAGRYQSLRIVIGEGEGHNWWCVLFPSVCRSKAEVVKEDYLAAGFSSSQYEMIKGNSAKKYKVRFKILEILSGVIGYDY